MSSHKALPKLGFVYVDSQCCTNCGVPVHHAPENFAWGEDTCYVKKQPSTATELRQVLNVFRYQELDCVRYAGTDDGIIRLLERVKEGDKVDRDGPRPSAGEQSTSCEPDVKDATMPATAENDGQVVSWWKRLWRR